MGSWLCRACLALRLAGQTFQLPWATPGSGTTLISIESSKASWESRRLQLLVGMGGGDDPEIGGKWVKKGVQWIQMGGDFSLMLRGASEMLTRMEEHIRERTSS